MTRIISIVGGLQPSTPTIGTATDGGTGTSANVAFTASSYIGKGTITYTATSSPGGLTGTGSSSPISVTGLTTGTAYTFTVVGTTNYGVSSLSSGSSNSVTPANPDSGSMFPIGVVTVGATPVASITFSSIPQTYTHLQFRFIVRTNRNSAEDAFRITINGDTNVANYDAHYIAGDGATAYAGEVNTGVGWAGYYPTNSSSSVFGAGTMDFLDYANTNKAKTMRHLGGYDANGSGWMVLSSSLWTSTAAINSIVFTFDSSSSFTEYSQMALYGIKGA